MSKGRRTPPSIHPAAPAASAPAIPPDAELRRAALLTLDVEAMRIWAATYVPPELNTIALADDAGLLYSMHEARMLDETIPSEDRYVSLHWLAEQGHAVAQRTLEILGRGQTHGGTK